MGSATNQMNLSISSINLGHNDAPLFVLFHFFLNIFSVSYPSMDPCLAIQIRTVKSLSFSLSVCTQ